MFRNQELRSIIIKVIIFQLLFAVIAGLVVHLYMGRINRSIVEQNQAMLGNILMDYPELEGKIIPYITKEISEERKKLGQETLEKYGYNQGLQQSLQPIYSKSRPSLQVVFFAIIGLFIIPLIFIIYGEYRKIYKKVRNVSQSAEKVVEGDFGVYLKDEGEGEFNILNHQFNQMANRLKNTLDTLEGEKVFLKNTISDISHQLKTPLSSLIMLNDLMLEDEKMDREVQRTFLERSKVQLERMEWLIINLLKMARIEAGAIQFKKEEVYLKDVALLAIESLGPKFDVNNISIHLSHHFKGVFYGDKEWTVEAFINILKNALEHSNKEKKIDIYIEETPLFSSITIKDYGQGIHEKDLPNIFKRFYKGNAAVKADSIGIGLNLAKLIIESQEGTISVNSRRGEGTTFIISFLLNRKYR